MAKLRKDTRGAAKTEREHDRRVKQEQKLAKRRAEREQQTAPHVARLTEPSTSKSRNEK